MKAKKFLIVLFLFFLNRINAEVNFEMTVTDEGLKNFYFAIGDFYKVPEKEIIVVRKQGIIDEELPVIFFLAKRAGVHYGQIVKWRVHNRWTWMKIIRKLRLTPEIFYIPFETPVNTGVYAKIYGYYKQPKNKWKFINLTDDEIIHCVNLHFISGYHGLKPVEVIKMRNAGKNFVKINKEVIVKKGGKKETIIMKKVKHKKNK